MSYQSVAVIGDLVDSRSHPDRGVLQAALIDALEAVNETIASQQPLAPTIGDEFQAVYVDVQSALVATLLVRLALPEGSDARFGLGGGTLGVVGESDYGLTQDGSAWWSAREAIDEVKRRAQRKNPPLRTWFIAADDSSTAAINAYLLSRDQIVGEWGGRSRRLARGMMAGVTQSDLAAAEGISQPAVSQHLHTSGAMAIAAGCELLHPGGQS